MQKGDRVRHRHYGDGVLESIAPPGIPGMPAKRGVMRGRTAAYGVWLDDLTVLVSALPTPEAMPARSPLRVVYAEPDGPLGAA